MNENYLVNVADQIVFCKDSFVAVPEAAKEATYILFGDPPVAKTTKQQEIFLVNLLLTVTKPVRDLQDDVVIDSLEDLNFSR